MAQKTRKVLAILAISLFLNCLIALVKIVYGRWSNSLAFIADGIHSLFDMGSTLLGMVSIVMATKPPDEEHPYGHQKFETLSALSLSVFLAAASYEVGTIAFQRLLTSVETPRFSFWGIVILVFTLTVNSGLAFWERKKAKDLQSRFLASDAIHNQSDLIITLGVLASLVCSEFQIRKVDALVSLAVAAYLIYLSVRLLFYNLKPLVDHSVLDAAKVEKIVSSIPGVLHCHHIRSRGELGHYFLDLNIHLSGELTLNEAHEITHHVEAKLKEAFPGLADVVIHTEPHDHPPCAVG